MRFCKPRFNSAVAPLSRSVLYFEPLLALAEEVSAVRFGNDPARVCQLFLNRVDEQKYIQAAMMTDAGDEAIQVTRYFDSGDLSQLASMPQDIHAFVLAISYLFVRKPAGCLQTGYTYFAIINLERSRLVHVAGKPKKIGGKNSVSTALLAQCLSRMAGWVRLSIQCIEYEYPDWHLLFSFPCSTCLHWRSEQIRPTALIPHSIANVSSD